MSVGPISSTTATPVPYTPTVQSREREQHPETAAKGTQELSPEEKREVVELRKRDQQVKSHEQAHLSALGPYRTGPASFDYTTGPDGKRYAVGGEVPIDLSEASTPRETIKKAQTIRGAALAPADPSTADRRAAAEAASLESEARAELTREAEATNADQETVPETGADHGEGKFSGPASVESPYSDDSSQTLFDELI